MHVKTLLDKCIHEFRKISQYYSNSSIHKVGVFHQGSQISRVRKRIVYRSAP